MPKGADQYATLAGLYDLLAGDPALQAFYREWREALLLKIKEQKIDVHTLVDLACGTGNSTIPWTGRRGWTVIGVDCSHAMLREARRKSRCVRWYCQDLRKLDLKERAEAVTCHFDALNHILDRDDLEKVFANVARILNENGLFQFDMNTEHWLRWLGEHEKLFRIGPHSMMAYNEFDPLLRIATFHQLWFVRKGKMYEKREITVQERAYSTADIRRMLRKAGLRLVKAAVQREFEGKPIRMLYLAAKALRRETWGPR